MKVRCLKCGETIESKSRHDLVLCRCEAVGIDGGKDYTRILFNDEKDFEVIE